MMKFDDSGRTRSVAIAALLLATVAVAVVAGFALGAMDSGSDERTGEEVLSDVQETYADAKSVSTDAVVTVEAANRTTEFEVSAAAAGTDQMRLNASGDGYYVLTGIDNGTVWRYDSLTGLTGVLDRDGNSLTASLRGGTEASARPGLSALPGGTGLDTELSTLLERFDGELPEGVGGELESLPANATVADVLNNNSLAGDINSGSLAGTGGELPGGLSEDLSEFEFPDEFPDNLSEFDSSKFELPGNLSEFELPDSLSEFELPDSLSEFELPDNLSGFEFPDNLSEFDSSEFELPGNLSGFELPDSLSEFDSSEFEFPDNLSEFNSSEFELPEEFSNYSEFNHSGFELPNNLSQFDYPEDWDSGESRERIDESLVGEFNASAVTVERVGTTSIDGQEANKLLITHPDIEAETRLWTGAESDTVLKQETTAPGLTVTVDVVDTRFDVSPADSTFEPPGASQLASLSVTTADSPEAFETVTSVGAAVPGDGWTFERGATLTGEAPSLTAVSGLEPTEIAAAAYTDEGSSVVVGQVDRTVNLNRVPLYGSETVTVDGREVRLLAGEFASVAVWSEAGTTVAVAGDLSGAELRSVVADIEL
jgi:outer membrane lipoprotein-sorting protein